MVAIKLQKEENREAFLKVFPTLADEVLLELRKYNMPEDAYEWTKKVRRSINREEEGREGRWIVCTHLASTCFSVYFAL